MVKMKMIMMILMIVMLPGVEPRVRIGLKTFRGTRRKSGGPSKAAKVRLATRATVQEEIRGNPLGHAGVPYWYTMCNTTLKRCFDPTNTSARFLNIYDPSETRWRRTCKVDTAALGFQTEWCTPPPKPPNPVIDVLLWIAFGVAIVTTGLSRLDKHIEQRTQVRFAFIESVLRRYWAWC
jgi:hypothetical protein